MKSILKLAVAAAVLAVIALVATPAVAVDPMSKDPAAVTMGSTASLTASAVSTNQAVQLMAAVPAGSVLYGAWLGSATANALVELEFGSDKTNFVAGTGQPFPLSGASQWIPAERLGSGPIYVRGIGSNWVIQFTPGWLIRPGRNVNPAPAQQ